MRVSVHVPCINRGRKRTQIESSPAKSGPNGEEVHAKDLWLRRGLTEPVYPTGRRHKNSLLKLWTKRRVLGLVSDVLQGSDGWVKKTQLKRLLGMESTRDDRTTRNSHFTNHVQGSKKQVQPPEDGHVHVLRRAAISSTPTEVL